MKRYLIIYYLIVLSLSMTIGFLPNKNKLIKAIFDFLSTGGIG